MSRRINPFRNRFLLATIAVGWSGWCSALGGACSLGVINGAWWIVVYESLILTGISWALWSDAIKVYRLAILTFLAASIPLLTIQVDFVLHTQNSFDSKSLGAYYVGYIVLLVTQYALVLVLGSESGSYLGQLGSIDPSDPDGYDEPRSEKQMMDESKDKRISMPNRVKIPESDTTLVHKSYSSPSLSTHLDQDICTLSIE